MNLPKIDTSWTLFLDRDGVVNRRLIDNYVKSWAEFEFLPGSLQAIKRFSEVFGTIVIVTNQQGIGKGLMTESDLETIHKNMHMEVLKHGGRIDGFYHCPELKNVPNNCRKPAPDMGYRAKEDFPQIDFSRSIMVGDSISDMEFGRNLGAFNVFITDAVEKSDTNLTDLATTNLGAFASLI